LQTQERELLWQESTLSALVFKNDKSWMEIPDLPEKSLSFLNADVHPIFPNFEETCVADPPSHGGIKMEDNPLAVVMASLRGGRFAGADLVSFGVMGTHVS
jgi:hypothetical protein